MSAVYSNNLAGEGTPGSKHPLRVDTQVSSASLSLRQRQWVPFPELTHKVMTIPSISTQKTDASISQ